MNFFNWLNLQLRILLSDETAIDAIEKAATKSAYATSGITIVSGLTVNEWGVLVGMLLGVLTFAFNVWFKMKYGRGNDER